MPQFAKGNRPGIVNTIVYSIVKEGNIMKNLRKLLMILGIMLSLALATSGTLAYLTDTDSDVNVMTLGNVDIAQLENGLADSGFKNAQPLYPAYYENEIDWDASKGVVDKEVTVENVGTSEAYVRTWFAFESGDMTFDEFEKNILVKLNNSPEWSWEWDRSTTYVIEDANGEASSYFVAVATLTKALPVGETTEASLLNVAMSKDATNKIVKGLGEYYTILVKTQAMQTTNFEEVRPADALGVGFVDEEVTDNAIGVNHPWEDESPVMPDFINNYDEMYASCFENGTYTIGNDFSMSNMAMAAYGYDIAYDLNGSTLTSPVEYYTFGAMSDGKLRLYGNGNVNMKQGFFGSDGGEIIVDGGTYYTETTGGSFTNHDESLQGTYCSYLQSKNTKMTINGGTFTTDVDNAALFYVNANSALEINGGFFENTADKTPVLLAGGMSNSSKNRVILKGGTFVNFNPMTDIYANKLGVSTALQSVEEYDSLPSGFVCVLWPGYEVVSVTQKSGDIWYTIVEK